MTPPSPSRRARLALAVLLLLVFLLGTAAGAATRIVPVGDSITHGMTDTDDGDVHPTYRYWLYEKLEDNGFDVDFVGSTTSPSFSGYSFDRGNEGHGGYRIGDIVDGVDGEGRLSSWLKGYFPDVALVLIGMNDVLWDTDMDERFENLGRLVETLRDRNPEIVIFIGTLPPTGDERRNEIQGLYDFNDRLPSWASDESSSDSPIRVVDLASGYDGVEDNQADRYIHPDESGERKIANRFYSALASYLDGHSSQEQPEETVTPTPTPTATPTPTPTVTPTDTATPTPTTTETATPIPVFTPAPVVVAIESPTPTIAQTTIAPAVTPTTTWGRRYAIGNPGAYLGTKFSAAGSTGKPAGSTSVTGTTTTYKPGDIATGIIPPTTKFVRWYPAARWAACLR